MRVLALVLAVVSLAAVPQEEGITSQQLSDSVLVVMGGGGNITAIAGRDGMLVVDSFTTLVDARKARELVEGFSHKPIRYLVNTHHHADHTFGNQVFADAAIVAHSNCARLTVEKYAERTQSYASARERVRLFEGEFREAVNRDSEKAKEVKEKLDRERRIVELYDGFELTPATLTSEAPMEIHLGDKTVRLIPVSPAHTEGDMVIHSPSDNLVITGDLLFHHMFPYIDVNAGADVEHWIESLQALYDLCDRETTVVPGHGEIGTRQAIADARDHLAALWAAVSAVHAAGKTLEQAKAEIKLEQYSHYGGYERSLPRNIEACWTLLEKKNE